MTTEALFAHCLSKPGARLTYPFGPDAAVFKAGDKMFALIYIRDGITCVTLKCDPILATLLRQCFPSVTPGYHMNKTHWNTILCDSRIPEEEVFRQIDHAHELIWEKQTPKGSRKAKEAGDAHGKTQ